jgi:hypothetical protein
MTTPVQSWPRDVTSCHALLSMMNEQNLFLPGSMKVAEEEIQELEASVDAGAGASTGRTAVTELDDFVAAERWKTVEDVAKELIKPGALCAEFARLKTALPIMYANVRRLKWNTHDAKMQQKPDSRARQGWQRRVDRALHRLMIDTIRARNSHVILALPLARSMVLEQQHIPYKTNDNLTRE